MWRASFLQPKGTILTLARASEAQKVPRHTRALPGWSSFFIFDFLWFSLISSLTVLRIFHLTPREMHSDLFACLRFMVARSSSGRPSR